jgi:hypothetical protein
VRPERPPERVPSAVLAFATNVMITDGMVKMKMRRNAFERSRSVSKYKATPMERSATFGFLSWKSGQKTGNGFPAFASYL